MNVRETLAHLVAGATLSEAQSHALFEELLAGLLEPAQIGAALALLQVRGVTADELVGAARVMRRHATPVPVDPALLGTLVDTCGTGGAPKTFNVSTLAAIVAAGAAASLPPARRVRVAKHGNRSRTGRGSAEILAALGVKVDASPEVQARCLAECGVCFSFAIHHHPAMKHAAPVRMALGFPTIFNVLGPLTNPAGARRQVMGVAHAGLVGVVGAALQRLGAQRAWVVHGQDGLDELSVGARTTIADVSPQGVRTIELDPAALGLASAAPAQLAATDLDDAVRMARDLLEGRERGPRRDMLSLAAGAALLVGGGVETIEAGLTLARAALDNGAAARTLEQLRACSQG